MRGRKKSIINFIVLSIICIATLCVYFVMPSTKADPDKPVSTQDVVVSAQDTGAKAASKDKKGGAVYVENYAVYTMKGGTIKGVDNYYGGAIYVSANATFNLEGGTIEGCKSKYGGAIYVENGGTVNITNGNIINCSSEYAPAIYCEYGGVVNISNSSIDENTIKAYLRISRAHETLEVGKINSGLNLRYIEIGSYPQTYVGSTMNTELNTWFTNNSPEAVNTYTTYSYTYQAYKYTDGNIYARVYTRIYGNGANTYQYRNGENTAHNVYAWFKVEPIKWIILNYDRYKSGEDNFLEVMSLDVLTGAVSVAGVNTDADGVVGSEDDPNRWVTSRIRTWLNDNFYNSAFSSAERALIKQTYVGNNINGNAAKKESDTLGIQTVDRLYIPSYWELSGGVSTATVDKNENSPFTTGAQRVASPSDYAVANVCLPYDNANKTHRGFVANYYLRSVYTTAIRVYYINNQGSFANSGLTSNSHGIRPVMRLAI